MRPREQFFEIVQAEFDAGRDPLDLPAVVVWLQEHPEVLEDFAELRLVSLQLADATPASTPPTSQLTSRRRWKVLAVSAVAAAFLLVVLPRWWSDQGAEPEIQSPVVKVQTPPNQQAVLLSHSASCSRSFIARDLAPATPTSGAVVLRMQSSTHHSKP